MRLARLRTGSASSRGAIASVARKLRGYNDRRTADAVERVFADSIPEVIERIGACFDLIEEQIDVLAHGAIEPRALGQERGSPGEEFGDASNLPSSADRAGGAESAPAGGSSFQLRYKADPNVAFLWDRVSEQLGGIEKELSLVLKVNDRAIDSLRVARISAEQQRPLALELTSIGTRLEALVDQIEIFRSFEDPEQVRWLTRRERPRDRRGSLLEFGSAPIRVADHLKNGVYDPMRTVILTSATLSVGGSIEFLADRLGLSQIDSTRFRFSTQPSPFDYPTQVLTGVPTDLPSPQSPQFDRNVSGVVFEILRAVGGRAFVLFTSYRQLRRTFEALEPRLLALGLRPAAQGDAGRTELLERFRSGATNVLFGTDSFWEGVDVKGRALECVIIARLPFRVPSEPVQEARYEDLLRQGANPFTSFTVPQAVLKFKQGFGRLIRARTDRGIVVVLDQRILTRPYGKVFLKSLPETRLRTVPLAVLLEDVRRFFGNAPPDPAPPHAAAPPASPAAVARQPRRPPARQPPPWKE
jgi:ATP-dependent DNA helicase DinG